MSATMLPPDCPLRQISHDLIIEECEAQVKKQENAVNGANNCRASDFKVETIGGHLFECVHILDTSGALPGAGLCPVRPGSRSTTEIPEISRHCLVANARWAHL